VTVLALKFTIKGGTQAPSIMSLLLKRYREKKKKRKLREREKKKKLLRKREFPARSLFLNYGARKKERGNERRDHAEKNQKSLRKKQSEARPDLSAAAAW